MFRIGLGVLVFFFMVAFLVMTLPVLAVLKVISLIFGFEHFGMSDNFIGYEGHR